MATPFKLKSGNTSAFKNLGSSPAKQIKEGSLPKDFNITGSKASTTPGYKDTKAAKTAKTKAFKEFDKWHKTLGKTKSIISKAGKFIGGKALGVAGMMMATSSKADQPKGKKSERKQIKDLLTKHKLKGGN